MSTMDKVKQALHLDKDKSTTSTTHHNGGVPEGTAGPHSNRVANAADPRIDSDLDSSRTGGINGTTHTGHGTTHAGHGTTGGYIGTSTGVTGTSGSTTAGPHSSNLANKIDPTVDSDLDGSRNMGATSGQRTAGYSGTGAGNNIGSNTGTTGGISHSTNAGPHDSNLANKVDPRVDSDLSSTGNRHGASTKGGILGSSGTHATPGSGTAQNTAGPHNSDLLNKLDPRVDSDLSGGKTYGGNATHQ
ncbi:hypothetical protein BGZ57DRAFT_1005243 [Hyaloscypha finlandica]|nr:hypothetical protein BGZ57DRAFT_1005243 [Hyaloscypha finlandica]